MSVRERRHFHFGRKAQVEDATATIPMQQTPSEADDEPLLLGFPAEFAEDEDDDDEPPVAGSPVQLVVVRRADHVAGIALILAGIAAAASLWFPWFRGEDFGLALLQRGVEDVGAGGPALIDNGSWPALAVLAGGVVLLLLGILLFRPARTHRLVGVLELFVAMGVAAGVLVLLTEAGWSARRIDIGLWCAVAVGALGLLGALKAMLTTPRVVVRHKRMARTTGQ